MLRKVDKNNEIFKSEIFKKDEVRYNLMFLIMESENAEFYSDEKSVILARGGEAKPIWIWNNKDYDYNSINDVYEILDVWLCKDKYTSVVCEMEMSEKIKARYELESEMNMGSYKCDNPVLNKIKNGFLSKAKLEELNIIAEFRVYEDKELHNIDSKLEDKIPGSKKLIESENFYVWRNNDNIITAIAYIAHESEKYSRINKVFTNPNFRCKGYAQMLVYEVCNIIKSKGKIPMLYTDYDYIPSNTAYKKIGFIDCGSLVDISVKC